jgi:hypothetical protein
VVMPAAPCFYFYAKIKTWYANRPAR